MHMSNPALVKYSKIFYSLYKHPSVQLSDLVSEECTVVCITLRIILIIESFLFVSKSKCEKKIINYLFHVSDCRSAWLKVWKKVCS